jgi:DNA polymerase-3 subunit alpha
MSALLSSEVSDTDKISELVAECQRLGLRILPPDVNASGLKFQPEIAPGRVLAIRYGLEAVKNVGAKAITAVISERSNSGPFASLEDFTRRVDTRDVTRKVVECFVKCGAFDSFGQSRAELFANIDSAIASASSHQRDVASGQVSLFDAIDFSSTNRVAAIDIQEWTKSELLAFEKELLGFYVTGHPLDEYRGSLEAPGIVPINTLAEVVASSAKDEKGRDRNDRDKGGRKSVKIAGAIIVLDKRFTKGENKPFAFLQVEDLSGVVEISCWSDTFAKYAKYLEKGKVVSIQGFIDAKSETPKIIAQEVAPLRPKASRRLGLMRLEMDPTSSDFQLDIEAVSAILRAHPGPTPVEIDLQHSGKRVRIEASSRFFVQPNTKLSEELRPWIQAGS